MLRKSNWRDLLPELLWAHFKKHRNYDDVALNERDSNEQKIYISSLQLKLSLSRDNWISDKERYGSFESPEVHSFSRLLESTTCRKNSFARLMITERKDGKMKGVMLRGSYAIM